MKHDTETLSTTRSGIARVACDHLHLIVDVARPFAGAESHALCGIHRIEIGRGSADGWERSDGCLRLTRADSAMSSTHAELHRDRSHWVVSDRGSKNGLRIGGVHSAQAPLPPGTILEVGRTFFVLGPLVEIESSAASDVHIKSDALKAGAQSSLPSLRASLAELERVASAHTPILIAGDTGTGKDLLARYIHRISGRQGHFVPVNCGGIPKDLLESEFFGAKRGAFSGAGEDRAGLVERAQGGTLFLDEIGDLPLAAQAALLRTLETGEVRRLGDSRARHFDVRVVAASHRDLEALCEAGDFREDLYARLAGHILTLPPLATRKSDLGILLSAILQDLAPERRDLRISTTAMRALLAYAWPRNIRELKRCLERALSFASDEIELDHLGPALISNESRETSELPAHEQERVAELIALLREHGGNISAVARAMGKVRPQIQRWLKRYELDAESYRNEPGKPSSD